MRVPSLTLVLLAVTWLCGCAATPLSQKSLDDEVFELAARNRVPLALEVTSDVSETVGYQYLFVLFPLGVVKVPAPDEYVRRPLYRMLAERGIRPLSDCADLTDRMASCTTLRVRVTELRVSAFDFFFTRRIRARVEIEAQLVDSEGRERWRSVHTGHAAPLRRYGFSQELSESLNTATEIALLNLFSQREWVKTGSKVGF